MNWEEYIRRDRPRAALVADFLHLLEIELDMQDKDAEKGMLEAIDNDIEKLRGAIMDRDENLAHAFHEERVDKQ